MTEDSMGKRDESAFRYFFALRRDQELEDNPDADMEEILKDVEESWSSMSESEKDLYRKRVGSRPTTKEPQGSSSHGSVSGPIDIDDDDDEMEEEESSTSTTSSKSSKVSVNESGDTSSTSHPLHVKKAGTETKSKVKPPTTDHPKKEEGALNSINHVLKLPVSQPTKQEVKAESKLTKKVKEENEKKKSLEKMMKSSKSIGSEQLKRDKESKDVKKQEPVKPTIIIEQTGRECKVHDCRRPAIKNTEMDDDFCSTECCVKYVNQVFKKFTETSRETKKASTTNAM